jgi:hypothetical protein
MKLLASIAFAVGLGMASAQAMPVAPLHDATGLSHRRAGAAGPAGTSTAGGAACLADTSMARGVIMVRGGFTVTGITATGITVTGVVGKTAERARTSRAFSLR